MIGQGRRPRSVRTAAIHSVCVNILLSFYNVVSLQPALWCVFRPFRLGVRTSLFQGADTGSNPVRDNQTPCLPVGNTQKKYSPEDWPHGQPPASGKDGGLDVDEIRTGPRAFPGELRPCYMRVPEPSERIDSLALRRRRSSVTSDVVFVTEAKGRTTPPAPAVPAAARRGTGLRGRSVRDRLCQ